MMRTVIAVVVWLLAAAAPAFGWGEDGHRIIGWIAYQHLTPEAKAEVDRLLATEGTNLPDACFWADAVARKQPQFRFANQLHYANVPRGEAAYVPERDRPAGGDVVSAIEWYRAVLADRSKPDSDRLEALRFLAHFVGDIHQPLHVGYGDDKGGNAVQVRFFDRGTNLHAVWDTGILQRGGAPWEQVARDLNAKLLVLDTAKQRLDPTEWAQGSFQLAVREVYPGVGPGEKLGQPYVDAKLPVVHAQLAVAGARLAAVLDATLTEPASKASTPDPTARLAAAPANVTVYVTKSGKKYHAEGCRHLTATKSPLKLSEAKQRYEPCKVCRPRE